MCLRLKHAHCLRIQQTIAVTNTITTLFRVVQMHAEIISLVPPPCFGWLYMFMYLHIVLLWWSRDVCIQGFAAALDDLKALSTWLVELGFADAGHGSDRLGQEPLHAVTPSATVSGTSSTPGSSPGSQELPSGQSRRKTKRRKNAHHVAARLQLQPDETPSGRSSRASNHDHMHKLTCPICFDASSTVALVHTDDVCSKDAHMVCMECAGRLALEQPCPMCRRAIENRVRLHFPE